MWETDWEALKKHPGYRPVNRGYEGRPNIVGVLKGTGGGRSLLLNGHTDVIPVGDGKGWSDDPWSADQEWAHLRSRLLRHEERRRQPHPSREYLKQLGFTPKGDVIINVVIDEEVSGHGTLDTVIRGYKADAGISGETSDLAVQPACIGRIWFEIEIQGKPAGIQKRYEGISGIDLGNKIARRSLILSRARRDRNHPLYPTQWIRCPASSAAFGRQLSQRVPGDLPIQGQHRHRSRRGSRRGKAEPRRSSHRGPEADPWMKHHPPKVRFVGYDAASVGNSARSSDRRTPSPKPIQRSPARTPVISGRQGAADTRFLNLTPIHRP